MEFTDVVRRRRMVRNYDPDRPVPAELVDRLLGHAVHAPSAGFSQGWAFLVLEDPADRDAFWRATTQADQGADSWLTGMRRAPLIIIPLANRDAYLDRYAEPDKGWTDRSVDRWPVPYWDTDTAMAAMLLLLGAEDLGLGALFFGVPGERHDAVRAAHGIPDDRRIVGVVALGHEAERVSGSPGTRPRRPLEEVLHVGRFGVSGGNRHPRL